MQLAVARHTHHSGGNMPIPTAMSPVVEAALRTTGRAVATAEHALQSVARPRIVIVGIGKTPPQTTRSLIEEAVRRGLEPGVDIIATSYADLRVGAKGGFVRLADGTGADGLVLAGQGQQSLFLFRGGGNLRDSHLRKIGAIQAVDGATAITDLSFIQRAGSKATTYDLLHAAGLSLAETQTVRTADEAVAAFDAITGRFGSQTAVLKKVNSLGGKDVHFVTSHDEVRAVIAKEPGATYVMQEYLPHARDQDVRVHLVWNHATGDFEVANSYVRNRTAFHATPNLANGGFPTTYTLSPWEEQQAREAARALAADSAHPPVHIGLDFFPRAPITASTVERNAALQEQIATGAITRAEAIAQGRDSVVIGEAASSAGTKGTEIVLGEGNNPVAQRIVDEILHIREHGVSAPVAVADARSGAHLVQP